VLRIIHPKDGGLLLEEEVTSLIVSHCRTKLQLSMCVCVRHHKQRAPKKAKKFLFNTFINQKLKVGIDVIDYLFKTCPSWLEKGRQSLEGGGMT